MKSEGVIKYRDEIVDRKIEMPDIKGLNSWRAIFYSYKLIGQDKNLYSGKGYGNLSMRLANNCIPKNKRSFVITGSQLGIYNI